MHAIGDVAITLPALISLTKVLPNTHFDFLTTSSSASMVSALSFNGEVIPFPDNVNRYMRPLKAFVFGLKLARLRYDIVIDLQRNWVSRLIRRMIKPTAWSEFDRFSPRAAGKRVLECCQSAGFEKTVLHRKLPVAETKLSLARALLSSNGWDGETKLILLNPAGLLKSRQWVLDNYVKVANLFPERVQFLLMGTERIHEKAQHLVRSLGDRAINLVGLTTLGEALAAVQYCTAIVSEDSGLMHMAWASGIPTVAIFGSTNHVWSSPVGENVRCFHSGDLECGDCMLAECKFGDNRCLIRVTPQAVIDALQTVIAKGAFESSS